MFKNLTCWALYISATKRGHAPPLSRSLFVSVFQGVRKIRGHTSGAVVAGPVGVTAAGSGVGQKGPVAGALVHAGGPWALTARAAPAGEAVALTTHTHPSSRARGVQAVHCRINTHTHANTDLKTEPLPLNVHIYIHT